MKTKPNFTQRFVPLKQRLYVVGCNNGCLNHTLNKINSFLNVIKALPYQNSTYFAKKPFAFESFLLNLRSSRNV